MAKKVDDTVLDAALNDMKTNVTRMTVCSGEPADFAAANIGGAVFLADATLASGDMIVSDGDTSGRKMRTATKTVVVDNTGTATHVALLDVTNSILKYVTTCTSLALTAASDVTFPAWDIEIADPT